MKGSAPFFLGCGLVIMNDKLDGLVVKSQSGFFTVATEQGLVVCQIPGRLKQDKQYTALVAIGDRVTISCLSDDSGLIEAVAERKRVLSRARPGPSRLNEQVLIANPDQMVCVFAMKQPSPNLRKLDRFLVVAEMNQVPAVIGINKIDLARPGEAESLFAPYEQLGYPVFYLSALNQQGISAFSDCLVGKISVLVGSSGVGKSSLLNALQPGLGLQVQQVSQATEKGMHTTRYAEMFTLDLGGYVADTPGIRSLALFDVEPSELDGYFREIAPLVANCRFSDCTHTHEKHCAVRAALATGRVSRQRYESYLKLREEHEQMEKATY